MGRTLVAFNWSLENWQVHNIGLAVEYLNLLNVLHNTETESTVTLNLQPLVFSRDPIVLLLINPYSVFITPQMVCNKLNIQGQFTDIVEALHSHQLLTEHPVQFRLQTHSERRTIQRCLTCDKMATGARPKLGSLTCKRWKLQRCVTRNNSLPSMKTGGTFFLFFCSTGKWVIRKLVIKPCDNVIWTQECAETFRLYMYVVFSV